MSLSQTKNITATVTDNPSLSHKLLRFSARHSCGSYQCRGTHTVLWPQEPRAEFSPRCFLAPGHCCPTDTLGHFSALLMIKKVLFAILYMLHSPDRSAALSPFSALPNNRRRDRHLAVSYQDLYFETLFSFPHFPCCKFKAIFCHFPRKMNLGYLQRGCMTVQNCLPG